MLSHDLGPVGAPCVLSDILVRVVGPMMSSNPPSMGATFAHACRPLLSLFSTHVPPTNTAVPSVPVSACRLLVVTKLTEGPSSSEVVRRMGAPPREFATMGHGIEQRGPVAAWAYLWSPGHSSGCVHGGHNSPATRQHEHYCMLSLPGRDIPQLLRGCTGAGNSLEERAGNKSR